MPQNGTIFWDFHWKNRISVIFAFCEHKYQFLSYFQQFQWNFIEFKFCHFVVLFNRFLFCWENKSSTYGQVTLHYNFDQCFGVQHPNADCNTQHTYSLCIFFLLPTSLFLLHFLLVYFFLSNSLSLTFLWSLSLYFKLARSYCHALFSFPLSIIMPFPKLLSSLYLHSVIHSWVPPSSLSVSPL